MGSFSAGCKTRITWGQCSRDVFCWGWSTRRMEESSSPIIIVAPPCVPHQHVFRTSSRERAPTRTSHVLLGVEGKCMITMLSFHARQASPPRLKYRRTPKRALLRFTADVPDRPRLANPSAGKGRTIHKASLLSPSCILVPPKKLEIIFVDKNKSSLSLPSRLW